MPDMIRHPEFMDPRCYGDDRPNYAHNSQFVFENSNNFGHMGFVWLSRTLSTDSDLQTDTYSSRCSLEKLGSNDLNLLQVNAVKIHLG